MKRFIIENPEFRPVDLLFPQRRKALRAGKCVSCEQAVYHEDFEDLLSKKEYSLSALCMQCQKATFAKDSV